MLLNPRLWAAASVAAASFLGLAALYLVVVGTQSGQYIDNQLMVRISAVFGVQIPTSGWFGDAQMPLLMIGFAAVAILLAANRSLRTVVEAGAIVCLTLGGAYVLKALLDRPSFGVGPALNSFPSNTVAVFAALTAVAVICAPSALRTLVLLYAFGVGAVASFAVVALQWHRPGDVLGAWLVAACAAGAVRTYSAAWSAETILRRPVGGQTAAHRG
ncbi:hypothetical protein GCM10009551_105140 [Nocardiopsis tropica]|uniref:phosphatase PAP2 family protein n=1 Tax=Tsukamurella TaxID=2060 RepID=UPI001C7DA189|nr:phosphatase PAP2 family protein [Tsukamurella sp. TY48]GIZ97092.1 hypothetical protein TTY48_17040 [Tsukamurella sp. TY48]